MNPFEIILPAVPSVPIVISIPHCGYLIPDYLQSHYDNKALAFIDDTDWFVDKLYAFSSQMGITIIRSVYSRWVIDLNRSPNDQPLYDDGRIITGLVPLTDFKGVPLYKAGVPDAKEIARRTKTYYQPYHDELNALLSQMKASFDHVLLWEAHSIRQKVPSIYKGVLPDLNLGDNAGKSAHSKIIDAAKNALGNSKLSFTHNHPFKGGFITRNFGQPDKGIHALQLEMTKINYMDDKEVEFNNLRASAVQSILKNTFEALIKELGSL